MRARYVILHIPDLLDHLHLEIASGAGPVRDKAFGCREFTRLFDAEDYCREGCRQNGLKWEPPREWSEGVLTLVGPWVNLPDAAPDSAATNERTHDKRND